MGRVNLKKVRESMAVENMPEFLELVRTAVRLRDLRKAVEKAFELSASGPVEHRADFQRLTEILGSREIPLASAALSEAQRGFARAFETETRPAFRREVERMLRVSIAMANEPAEVKRVRVLPGRKNIRGRKGVMNAAG